MKYVAIDDEPLALDLIKKYAAEFPFMELDAVFEDALEGITYLQSAGTDLLFVDINMPDLTGLELVQRLPEKPIIIFTTAHRKYAVEGFELEALDYLLKPITPDRFRRAVQRALEQHELRKRGTEESAESIVVRSEYKLVKIQLNAIQYIEGMEDYIKIHHDNSLHPVLTLMSLREVLSKLPPGQFSRIHRSYIVANARVSAVSNKKVYLADEKELPVSDSYLDFISQWKKN